MCEITRVVFDFFKLFWVHKYDELCLRLNGLKVLAHARTFWSIALITLFSIAIICLHKVDYTKILL